jgi:hypothetical protein
MAIAVAGCGFHSSGIQVNPQDIAPKHAGSVFGMVHTIHFDEIVIMSALYLTNKLSWIFIVLAH